MKIIGLTGPSGSGKSIFCLAAKDFPSVTFIDTDLTARQVVEKGKPCLDELACAFGSHILLPDGSLNREKLASIAFSDPIKHKTLNKITHTYITKHIKLQLVQLQNQNLDAVIIDAPLLFESGLDRICDFTICIISPYEKRLARVLKRDTIDEKHAKMRLDSQPDEEFYTSKSNLVIYNDSTIESMLEKSKSALSQILG